MSERALAEPPRRLAGCDVTVVCTLSVLRAGRSALLAKTPRALVIHAPQGVRAFVLDDDASDDVRALLTRLQDSSLDLRTTF